MEMETMFVDQRWNILEQLSEKTQSPIQLAEKLNTTMANVSQQLRFLEATNLVQKKKIKNRDKGQPRTLFSLKDDYAYLVSAMSQFADKRLLKVTDHDKAILRIWFLKDQELHMEVERLYWKLEPSLNEIDLFAADQVTNEILIVTENPKLKTTETELKTRFLSRKQATVLFDKNPELKNQLLVIFDPNNFVHGGDA